MGRELDLSKISNSLSHRASNLVANEEATVSVA